MSSVEQIQANRRNAQKSTGPRSVEGKARVSRNAITHGAFARSLLVEGECAEELQRFRQGFVDELCPASASEAVLLDQIVSFAWRLQRLQSAMVYFHEQHAGYVRERRQSTTPGNVLNAAIQSDLKVVERFSCLEQRLNNQMMRSLRELKRSRKEREADLTPLDETKYAGSFAWWEREPGEAAEDAPSSPLPVEEGQGEGASDPKSVTAITTDAATRDASDSESRTRPHPGPLPGGEGEKECTPRHDDANLQNKAKSLANVDAAMRSSEEGRVRRTASEPLSNRTKPMEGDSAPLYTPARCPM